MTSTTVFNRTGGPLLLDDEGHQIDAGEYVTGVDVDTEPIAGHIAADRLVITKRARGARRAPQPTAPVEAAEPILDPGGTEDPGAYDCTGLVETALEGDDSTDDADNGTATEES